ncbi:hypothetical protein F5Y17DRAFT_14059 [Xylariaceae sp. FL0594]|nr:hypothetical protein F5Y17DRAFT_14059 [Xylariaceae sp. FL0594]
MDSAISRKEALERRNHRALSQSSTASTTHTQATTHTTSTSSSHSSSATRSSVTHGHVFTHSQGGKFSIPVGTRAPSRLLREPRQTSTKPMTPVSSLLHEKLRQERLAESERMANRYASDRSSSTTGVRDACGSISPGKRYKATVERRSVSSHADDSSQNSMGAKQAEQAVSTLHKQNFDLKLELFHRREKQSMLEARIGELEEENADLRERQKGLLEEVSQRDKAIGEAVNMIVKLELQIGELVRQREEVGFHVRTDGSYLETNRWNLYDLARTNTPKPGDHGRLSSTERAALERMPSFLSDRSTHTENLRNVVLQNRSGLRHIRQVSEVSTSSADVSEVNRIASPSLSILSESSFMSIYGSKAGPENSASRTQDDLSSMDGTLDDRSPTPTRDTAGDSLYTQNTTSNNMPNMARMDAHLSTNLSSSIDPVLRRRLSHQMMEPMRRRGMSSHGTYGPLMSERDKDVAAPTPGAGMSPSRPGVKDEKRESLQRVVTNYPNHKELANSHALPPTPDTVASSVLREHKDSSCSQDSLVSSDGPRNPRAHPISLSDSSAYLRSLGNQEAGDEVKAHMASADPRHQPDMRQLPHSVIAAPIARPRADSFVSDSDSDGGADAHSDTETCDYWMRESYKPDRGNTASKTTIEQGRGRSPSPDLFSFPSDAAGWEPDAMFGALKGNGFLGSPVAALKRDPLDEMASSLRTANAHPLDLPEGGVPQHPSRRLSLNTHVAGHLLLSTFGGKAGKGSSQDGLVSKPKTKGRSNSIDGAGHRALPSSRADGGPTTKRSQYPPISGLQSRGRGLGLNMLFKRSGLEGSGTPSSANEATFPSAHRPRRPPTAQGHIQHVRRPSGRNSVPPPATMPWASRLHGADLQSATPPPIMRNRPRAAEVVDAASSETAEPELSQAATATASAMNPAPEIEAADDIAETPAAVPQGVGGMRKWLGLGKKSAQVDKKS